MSDNKNSCRGNFFTRLIAILLWPFKWLFGIGKEKPDAPPKAGSPLPEEDTLSRIEDTPNPWSSVLSLADLTESLTYITAKNTTPACLNVKSNISEISAFFKANKDSSPNKKPLSKKIHADLKTCANLCLKDKECDCPVCGGFFAEITMTMAQASCKTCIEGYYPSCNSAKKGMRLFTCVTDCLPNSNCTNGCNKYCSDFFGQVSRGSE